VIVEGCVVIIEGRVVMVEGGVPKEKCSKA
jgi:hypothetical protein